MVGVPWWGAGGPGWGEHNRHEELKGGQRGWSTDRERRSGSAELGGWGQNSGIQIDNFSWRLHIYIYWVQSRDITKYAYLLPQKIKWEEL